MLLSLGFSCAKKHLNTRECLVNAHILVKAQIDQSFILTSDASDIHVGAVLSQFQRDGTNKPTGYFSRKLSPCKTRYSVTDKKALAVVLACWKYHHFLLGAQFTVVTNHQPLTSIFKRKTKFPRINKRVLEIREYNHNIQYLKGKYSYVTDQMSRPVLVIVRPPETTWLGLSRDQFIEKQ